MYAPQLDAGRITACVQGELGTALMHRNAQLTDALDPPHQYVPWVVINGVGGAQGSEGGRGDRPCDEQPHVSPQKHTDELQAEAQSSLLRLVCQLYQVGRGWG